MIRSILIGILLVSGVAFGQQGRGSLKGQVSDEFGGVIVGATVVVTDAKGATKTATTNGEGGYAIVGLAPGKDAGQVSATGFATDDKAEVEVTAGKRKPRNVTLKGRGEQQKVTGSYLGA